MEIGVPSKLASVVGAGLAMSIAGPGISTAEAYDLVADIMMTWLIEPEEGEDVEAIIAEEVEAELPGHSAAVRIEDSFTCFCYVSGPAHSFGLEMHIEAETEAE
jgi:hypothetical protein